MAAMADGWLVNPRFVEPHGIVARAGRRLLVSRSVKGNGTTATSRASRVTVGFFVGLRQPFAQGSLERLQMCRVARRRLGGNHSIAVHLEPNEVAPMEPKPISDLLGIESCPLLVTFPGSIGDYAGFLTSLHQHGRPGAAINPARRNEAHARRRRGVSFCSPPAWVGSGRNSRGSTLRARDFDPSPTGSHPGRRV